MFVLVALALLLTPVPALSQQDGRVRPAPMALEPGDVVQVRVWREPDLSGEFVVDESGMVTLPLLGEWQVAGIPIDALRDSLFSAYRVQLRNPSIVITPLRRVYVLGEVNQPGLRVVDPTISLAGVIALAGGANPQGDLRRIRVIRDGRVILDNIPVASALADVDIRSGDQVFVGRRSWFDRNSTFVVSALLSITSIVVTLVQ